MNNFNRKKKYVNKKKYNAIKDEKEIHNAIIKKIKIKKIDNPIEKAINWYNNTNDANISYNDSPSFLVRIAINLIRHSYSNYDRLGTLVKGDKKINREHLKSDVNKKILRKYNNFEQELIH